MDHDILTYSQISIMETRSIFNTSEIEFMVLEECWNISKDDLLVLTFYRSFIEFRIRLGQYFRTKHFNLNMRNYLTGNMSENLS